MTMSLGALGVLLGSFTLATTACGQPEYPLLRDRIDPAFQKSVEEVVRAIEEVDGAHAARIGPGLRARVREPFDPRWSYR